MTRETAAEIGRLLTAQLDVIDPPDDAVRTDMPEDDYHAHPALSSSGAKSLLPPGCPALFAYEREHGRSDTRAFDYGHAAHKLVLGAGMDIVAVDAPDWRTKAAKEQAAEARAAGATPLLLREHAQVVAMAAKLREHPLASALLDPAAGAPEVSLFWNDDRTGVQLRARLDWLPQPRAGRMIIPDYKTAGTANPWEFRKAAANFGYYLQAAWYSEAVQALRLADDVAFLFVVQQKTPPYLVSVVQLDADATRLGERDMRRAVDTFRDCTASGRWPSYSSDVVLVSLPPWFGHQPDQEDS